MFASLWLVASLATAAEPRALSIEDALRLAQDASESLDVAEAGVTRATGRAWTSRSGFLPTIGASTGWQHTFASEFDDLFGDPGQGGLDLPFGKRDAWRVDLTASQTLFDGGRMFADARLGHTGLESSRLSVDQARARVVLDTAAAYYDAVLADRLLEIARATLAQSETTLEHARLAMEVGRSAEFDVVLAGAEVEAQRVAVIRAERLRDTARLRLAQALDLPADDLVLTSPLDGDVAPIAAEVAGVHHDAERVVVRQGELGVTMAKAGVAAAWAPWLPRVSLSGSIGWVSYPDTVLPPTDGEAWRDNIFLGLNVSLPIFSGGRIYGALLDARGGLWQARATLEQTTELAELDAAQARADLESAEAQWKASEASVEQARRAHEIAQVRYAEGVSTQSELVDARLLEQRAEAGRAQAARDLQIARLRVALLPSLPLGLSPF